MPGSHANLTQVKLVLAMRETGCTRLVIANETGLSVSTVARICKRFSARKGRIKRELVEAAQKNLIEKINDSQSLLNEATNQLADDLALSKLLRERIASGVLSLITTDPTETANSLRALNSAASAFLSVQKASRIATGADSLADHNEELPVLQISEMSADDIKQVKENLRRERNSKESKVEGDEQLMVH
jgi:predicted transcriptional regulator